MGVYKLGRLISEFLRFSVESELFQATRFQRYEDVAVTSLPGTDLPCARLHCWWMADTCMVSSVELRPWLASGVTTSTGPILLPLFLQYLLTSFLMDPMLGGPVLPASGMNKVELTRVLLTWAYQSFKLQAKTTFWRQLLIEASITEWIRGWSCQTTFDERGELQRLAKLPPRTGSLVL